MKLGSYAVPNDSLKLRARMQFESEDLSGQSSSTTRAHKGIKPKEFTVNLIVRTKDEEALTRLIAVAEKIDDDGKLEVYPVVEQLINAMKVKQVQFFGSVNVQEIDGKRAWQVSFTLVEYLSVAEKIEARDQEPTIEVQEAEGVISAPFGTTPDEAPQYSGFEGVFHSLDNALAPDEVT